MGGEGNGWYQNACGVSDAANARGIKLISTNGRTPFVEQAVVNLIDVGPVVDRLPLRVFRIHAHFVVKDGVKANVLNVGGRFHGPQIAPVAVAQRENRTSGAKHLFPIVRKRTRGGLRVDGDFLGGRSLLA